MNITAICGRLTADPEVRQSQSGSTVCRFSVAVDRAFKREGGKNADFFRCVAFGKSGDFVSQYFHKGGWIGVEGRMEQDEYTDKNGNRRESWTLTAQNVGFVGNKTDSGNFAGQSANGVSGGSQAAQSDEFAVIDDNEDLPFN